MLNILIVDDEPPARARLRRLLAEVPGCDSVAEAGSASEAMEMLSRHPVDALLLDISMPGLDGMALARQLAAQDDPPAVVFCTAWPDQALEAFECDAVDYLVKPVRAERLQSALQKVARLRGRPLDEDAGRFLRSTVGGKTSLVPVEEVICLIAEDKYTTVFYVGGETVINNSLVELEKRFEARFLRVHRKALVAIDRIRGLAAEPSGSHHVVLEGCELQPLISRRHLPAVRKFIRGLA
jgi:two-component system response regulator AlgR